MGLTKSKKILYAFVIIVCYAILLIRFVIYGAYNWFLTATVLLLCVLISYLAHSYQKSKKVKKESKKKELIVVYKKDNERIKLNPELQKELEELRKENDAEEKLRIVASTK